MKTRFIFHASTEANIQNILKEGFKNKERVWNCSDEEYIYFYEIEAMAKAEGLDPVDDFEEVKDCCIRRAFENAQITASKSKYTGDKLQCVVLEIEEKFIEIDKSCDEYNYNIGNAGAVQVHLSALNIASNKIEVYTSYSYYPSMMAVYLKNFIDNDMINLDNWNEVELEFIRRIDCESILEHLLEIEWV